MKRFFSKKSVAIISVAIILLGSFWFNFVEAQQTQTTAQAQAATTMLAPQIPQITGNGVTYFYQYGANTSPSNQDTWLNPTTVTYIKTSDLMNMGSWASNAQALASQYQTAYSTYVNSTGLTPGTGGENLNSTSTGSSDLSGWPGLGTIFNYGIGIISFYGGTGAVIGFLKLVNMAFGAFVAIAAFIFDQSITLSILHIKTLFDSTGAVSIIWTMLRDLINITFIFIVLYMGIAKIIGSWGIKAKTTLMSVIISAIFINFSMFFAKILIDAGNIVAVQLYQSIMSTASAGFTNLLFGQLGIKALATSALSLSGQINLIISNLLAIALNIILIWVFLYGAFILLGRAVMLLLLTMTSPIGFIGGTIPLLGDYSGGWWKAFTDQIMVGPAMMFLLLIVTKILTNTQLKDAINAAQGSLTDKTLDTSSFLFSIIMIFLLIKGMGYVKKLSGEVAGTIIKVATVAAVGAAAVATGGAAVGLSGLAETSLGKSALSSAGNLASKAASSKWGARLALTAKDIGTKASVIGNKVAESGVGKQAINMANLSGKFVTGDYEKSGAAGWLQTQAREKIMVHY